MSDPGRLPEIRVSGGAGGIDAQYDDLERLGRLYSETGSRLAGFAWDDKLEAADGDLLASAVLSPGTFAAAESAILDATYGPDGLAARAALIEVQSFAFGAVVELYRTADDVQRALWEALCYRVGFVVGLSLPALTAGGGLVLGGLYLADPELAAMTTDELIDHLEDHPEVVETLVNGGGGLLDGMTAGPLTGPLMTALGLDGFHPDTGSAAGDLGELLFGDYHGDLNDDYPDDAFDLPPPHGVQDLMDNLAGSKQGPGVIAVQQVVGSDGETRWVVSLPGTDDFTDEHSIRNMGSNLNLVEGDDTAYGEAIAQAMAAAGVGPDDPVMLVGHSQGGMQAAGLAADPDFGYHVTHVVTAGSPIATAGIPDHVSVLSLENTGGVVPLLDGDRNPGSANHTTVHADVHSGSFGAGPGQNHSLETYASIGSAVDASDDPSLQHAIDGMQGFFGGTVEDTQTHTYQTQHGDQIRPPGMVLP